MQNIFLYMRYYNFSLTKVFKIFYSTDIYYKSTLFHALNPGLYSVIPIITWLSHFFVFFWWAEYSSPTPNKTKIFKLKIEARSFCLKSVLFFLKLC